MTKLSERTDITSLEGGWVNLTEAADILGFTRSYMYKIAGSGSFKTIKRIGTQASYIVNTSELDDLIAGRTAVPEEAPAPKKAPAKKKVEPVAEPAEEPVTVDPIEAPLEVEDVPETHELTMDEILAQI